MRVVIPGGTGQVGEILRRALVARGDDVTILSRGGRRELPREAGSVLEWDARTLGAWASSIDGADVVINLSGRSVDCRYSQANLDEMMRSRVDSTRVVGEAIAQATRPPPVWLQMSTATIYAHTLGPANDEATGAIGGDEPDVPGYWRISIDIAKAWERTQAEAPTPATRKVAMRSAMVMSPDPGGIFDVLRKLARRGLGGPSGGGKQFVSWIHAHDFVRAVLFLIERNDLAGPINLASPHPLPQAEFMSELRSALGVRFGLPATRWMLEIGAFFLRTDTELLLKSRRVIPGRLAAAGFTFDFPEWHAAAADLAKPAPLGARA